MTKRERMLQMIQTNIDRFGHHVYIIAGSACPRFAYTIGLSPKTGFELVLAGASMYSIDEVKTILNRLAEIGNIADGSAQVVDSLGEFRLRKLPQEWSRNLILGAADYYSDQSIDALQVVPDPDHWTLDVPDTSKPMERSNWRWLVEEWVFEVSPTSKALTTLSVLKGDPVTEIVRAESDEWHFFAKDTDPERESPVTVSLGTMLGVDSTFERALDLSVGRGMRRGEGEDWYDIA